MKSTTKNYKSMLDNCENNSGFYKSEILPDYQERARDMLAKLRAISDVTPNRVGMEAISGTAARERYFIEFAINSSFHGLNHIVARGRHPVERFLVILLIGACLISEIFVSLSFWYRYQNDAVIQVLELNENFQIPRPSILICSTKQIDETKFPETFRRYGVKDTPQTRSFFQFLADVDYKTMHETPEFDAVPPEKWLRILYDLRYEFSFTFNGMQNATPLWIITETGMCVSVRNYVSVYATLEYWLQDNWTVLPPPKVVPLLVNDDYIETITSFTAMRITLYRPSEMIEYQFTQINVQRPKIKRCTFSTLQYVTNSKTKGLSAKQRKCKFMEDGGLTMWPVYTARMCIIECRYQTIRQHCGCLPHFARPIADIPICDAAQLRCIGNITNQLFLYRHVPARCNCPQNCNDIYYLVDNSATTTGVSITQNASIFNGIVNFPKIIVKREQLFGFIDFLVAIGGVAGLFLGASALSFIEIFYYATLRMWVHCAKRKRTQKKRNRREEFAKN